jgi:hypothetical protein
MGGGHVANWNNYDFQHQHCFFIEVLKKILLGLKVRISK